jgi:hypothetical protein
MELTTTHACYPNGLLYSFRNAITDDEHRDINPGNHACIEIGASWQMIYYSPDATKSLFELGLMTSLFDETLHVVEFNIFVRPDLCKINRSLSV